MNDTDRCSLGSNYFLPGTPCTISGDPHYSLWNGARHDFQGQSDEGLYHYVTPCRGSHHGDMPFDVMGKHRKYKGSVQGLEYLVFNLFGQNDDDLILLFFSASFQSVFAGAEAMGPLYEDNMNSAAIIDLQADTQNVISPKFNLFVALHSIPSLNRTGFVNMHSVRHSAVNILPLHCVLSIHSVDDQIVFMER